jgi:hypothetical protein
MSVATDAATTDHVITASPRSTLRRYAVLLVVVAAVLIGVILIVIARSAGSASHDPLSATNPAPEGSRALVQVLEQHGVRVIPADSLEATRTALAGVDAADATVMVYDPQSFMTPAQHGALLSLGTDVVAVEPDLLALPDLAPGVGLTGKLGGSFTADCPVDAVQKAASVSASGVGYRITASKDGVGTDEGAARDAVTCLTKKGASGLIELPRGGTTLSILGLGSALQNGTIASKGDAALALNLLGAHRTLIWYVSTYADLQQGPTPSLAELTPGWVAPLFLRFLLAGVAAGVWRGRRFGPVVVENLPVVVRASETMEGRARLYSRARARLRALDALRIGTVERLAKAVGLPRTSTVTEVADAAAALTGRDRAAVSALLLDAVPGNDTELVRLSDELLTLEAEVAATRPGSSSRTAGESSPTESPENGHHG